MKKKIVTSVAAVLSTMIFLTGCGTGTSDANGGFDDTNGITVISREDGSGTRGAFVELLGIEEKVDGEKVDLTTTEAQITNSTSVMMTTVAEDEYAIGYISLGAMNDTVKALEVDGVKASDENIKNASYQVARPFNIVTNKAKNNPIAKDFIRFILSKEGQEVVTNEKYIEIDNTGNYVSANVEGKIVVGGSSSVSPVMEKLKEAYQTLNPEVTIELQTTDSTTGVSATVDGNYDIGMVSREVKEEEKQQGLVDTEIAKDGIAIIVNHDNPITNISKEVIKNIYKGDVITWNEVTD
ncbi:MAG TPA: substrate-binding domain-containing protein [Candidatus Dorea intestinavium]|nr:substrate-binding domain-containing protein [Candidatus Dorea intestinavium]